MRSRISFLVVALCLVTALISVGCSRRTHNTVTLAGSTAFQPFAEKLVEHYLETHKGVQINVQGGGSAVGIQSALSGVAEIGMADLVDLPPEARPLTPTIVARDGIAIVANPANPVTNLSASEAHDIFTGRIVNWKEIGWEDAQIHVISREEGSGTRSSFDKFVLHGEKLSPGALFQNSNGTCREAVASDAYAIGYVSIGLVNSKVKALLYDGTRPTNENVKKGRYHLARPVYFLTNGAPKTETQGFIDYVLSPEAQKMLEKEGLIAAK